MLTITDDFVSFRGYDEPAVIEHVSTADETARAWAETYFDSLRGVAEHLTVDGLGGSRAGD